MIVKNWIANHTATKFTLIGIILLITIIIISSYTLDAGVSSPIVVPRISTPLTPEATPLYDPAQYGVPDTLGGHKVLAVLTPQDVACMPSGAKRVVLQTSEPNVHEYLESPKPITEILELLKQLPGEEETKWIIEVVGPDATLERMEAGIKNWNSLFSGKPCRRLGGPIITATPVK